MLRIGRAIETEKEIRQIERWMREDRFLAHKYHNVLINKKRLLAQYRSEESALFTGRRIA